MELLIAEETRSFDELPERVWSSQEGQLVKSLADFGNSHSGTMAAITKLASIRQSLPGDIDRMVDGLRLVLNHGETYSPEIKDKLNSVLDDDSWEQQEVIKLARLARLQTKLEEASPALNAFLTLSGAMSAVDIGGDVAADQSGMVLRMFDQPLPEGGPNAEHVDHKTPIYKIIGNIQTTLRDVTRGLKSIEDSDISGARDAIDPNHVMPEWDLQPPSELSEEFARLATSPEAVAIETRTKKELVGSWGWSSAQSSSIISRVILQT